MALENWNIDVTHSTVGFTVRHLMVSKVHGQFTKDLPFHLHHGVVLWVWL